MADNMPAMQIIPAHNGNGQNARPTPTGYISKMTAANFPDPELLTQEIAKRNTGAISKFTPELAAKYLEAIIEGKTEQEAAELIGVSRVTVARWKRLLPDFCYAAAQAREDGAEHRIEEATKLVKDVDPTEDHKQGLVALRKGEILIRAAHEHAKVNNPRYIQKNISLNVDTQADSVDLSKFFNKG